VRAYHSAIAEGANHERSGKEDTALSRSGPTWINIARLGATRIPRRSGIRFDLNNNKGTSRCNGVLHGINKSAQRIPSIIIERDLGTSSDCIRTNSSRKSYYGIASTPAAS